MKHFLIFIFLLNGSLTAKAQNQPLLPCSIYYGTWGMKDTNQRRLSTSELMIRDASDSMLFDWQFVIGHLKIRRKGLTYKIKCYAVFAQLKGDTISYYNKLICKLKYDKSDCSIQKKQVFKPKVDTSRLIELYEPLKTMYLNNVKQDCYGDDSLSEATSDMLMLYGQDLCLGALMGSKRCQLLHYRFFKEFFYVNINLRGLHAIGHNELIERLCASPPYPIH